MINIEKSAFKKGAYVGYANGAWIITKTNSSYGNWIARKQDDPSKWIYAFTLKEMSRKLEALNAPNKNPRGGKFDRCVAEVRRSRSAENPYAVCASALKARRLRNPRKSVMRGAGMFRLIAKRGNTRLVYVGGGKFSHHGEPVYFRSVKSAELTARWLLRSFIGLKGFTFHAVSNS